MLKITKKQYNARSRFLALALSTVQQILTEAKRTNGANLVDIEDWNEFHDQERGIEKAQDALEHEWDTRKWTAAEWSSWNLITSNID